MLIALALVAAETASAVEPRPWTVRLFAIVAGGLVIVFAASAIAGLIAGEIRSNPQGARASLRGYSHLRRLHTAIWFVVSLTAVTVAEWPQWIELELYELIVIDELIVLLPLLLPMYFSHAAFFEVDRAAAHVLGSDRSRHRAGASPCGHDLAELDRRDPAGVRCAQSWCRAD